MSQKKHLEICFKCPSIGTNPQFTAQTGRSEIMMKAASKVALRS